MSAAASRPKLTVDMLGAWPTCIESMLHAVWLVDARELRIVCANSAASKLLAVPPPQLLGAKMVALAATPEDLCFWDEVANDRVHEIESETLLRRFDGVLVPVLRRISRVRLAKGATMYVVAVQDRSEQVRADRELEAASAQLRATLESTADGILVTDLSGRIRNFNRRFAALWGMPDEMLARNDDDSVLEWMRRSVVEPAEYMRRLSAIDDATMLQASDVLTLHSGTVLERFTVPQCSGGRPIGRVFSYRDITEKVEARRRIEVLSQTDALTGLPNRQMLGDRPDGALATAQRDGVPFALLMLNLDRFKSVNEILGHALGDCVLQDVAQRLNGGLRQIDTVARLGGDEFVLLVQQSDREGAEAAARRVMDALQRPFTQAGMNFTVTASVGIALFPDDGVNGEELMRCAEAAMREAKVAGRAGYRFHHSRSLEADARARVRMRLDHAMRQALAQGRFRLHYQPQLCLASGQVVGAEALLRWRDPELGDVSPGEFIPIAEESGFIVPIGAWVLRQAVKQAAAWHAQGRHLVVSVNVSALQFQQPGFVEGVASALREAGLPAALLELELTESILIQDAQQALLRLEALARLGVKLTIDDFGTGYSSLSYLKRFPIDRLKIDRSFVGGLPSDRSDAGIAVAIIQMGRALKLEIIAEGVETEAQRSFLEAAGCDLFQGFLFAPALDVMDFESRLDADEPAPVASNGRVLRLRQG
jgi:diguanylate cyclase (GGDEF)-like protein/PAS domain S-box-containing protein